LTQKSLLKRWIQKDSETWQSLEDENIRVHANEEYDEENNEVIFLVYPSHKYRGIPNSPSTFSTCNWGTEIEAQKYATKEAEKILQLPIEKIRKFEWSMIK